MIRAWSLLVPLALLAVVMLARDAPADPPVDTAARDAVQPFLKQHCLRCHGPTRQEADRRWDTLSADLSDPVARASWQLIAARVEAGEMPPDGEPRPSPAARAAFLEWTKAAGPADREAGLVRRLSAREYRNSVEDLLGYPLTTFDENLVPSDELVDGFDNISSRIGLSRDDLERYLGAANALDWHVEHRDRPPRKTYRFAPPFQDLKVSFDKPLTIPYALNGGRYEDLYSRPSADNRLGARLILDDLADGVPESGYYTIRVRAEALGRNHPYATPIIDKTTPLRLGIRIIGTGGRSAPHTQADDTDIVQFELGDDGARWYEHRVWLNRGDRPWFTYPNGPVISNLYLLHTLLSWLHDDIRAPIGGTDVSSLDLFLPFGQELELVAGSDATCATSPTVRFAGVRRYSLCWMVQHYQGPRVRVHAVELVGPDLDAWPPPYETKVLGGLEVRDDRVEEILRRFAGRAFRRPVADTELASLVELYRSRLRAGDDPARSLRSALVAVLVSPAFLYRSTSVANDYDLASRLSYFLWSSTPDEQLLDVAARGALKKNLPAELDRILRNPRAERFARDFVAQWLELTKIKSVTPDPNLYPAYYLHSLDSWATRETTAFFENALRHNLDIGVFLSSTFTFLNEDLAKFYGISGVHGQAIRRVELHDRRRGGLLGEAAVLTATANGVDTSPVLRGVWVLRDLLCMPPAPPPANVAALDADVRGATTIRQRLDKHRVDPTCRSCHQKIDPPGFALESFDASGGWRTYYDAKHQLAIDAAGELDGNKFRDIVELKPLLASRFKDQFARCMTEKLLSYATGRVTTASESAIDDIVARARKAGQVGLMDLVEATLTSERVTGDGARRAP